MAALAPMQHMFEDAAVRLVFISSSTPTQTREFVQRTVVKVPGELYSDPTLYIHNLFDLKRGVYRSLFAPLWPGFKRYGLAGILEGFRLGFEMSHLVGDSWQQGGTFLLDSSAKVLFQHREEYPGNWAPMDGVMKVLGMKNHFDYKLAVSNWIDARRRQRESKPWSGVPNSVLVIIIVIIIIIAVLVVY